MNSSDSIPFKDVKRVVEPAEAAERYVFENSKRYLTIRRSLNNNPKTHSFFDSHLAHIHDILQENSKKPQCGIRL